MPKASHLDALFASKRRPPCDYQFNPETEILRYDGPITVIPERTVSLSLCYRIATTYLLLPKPKRV